MKTIKTVTGLIAPEQVGFTDIHDHVWKSGGMEVREDKDFGIESIVKSNDELKRFADAGGKTLVDMQPIGVGRGVKELKEIVKGTSINLVAATGFHRAGLYDKSHFVYKYSVDQITKLVVSEVEEGIEVNDFCGPYVEHSDVLPGVVKAGTSYYKINPLEEKLMTVAARTSMETGIPICTHTDRGTMGLEQALYFKKLGVSPQKICIGHLDRNADLVYHQQVLKEGVYIEYDCVARVKYHPLCDTMNLIKILSEQGYADRIMIGGDWGRASYLQAYGGQPGLEFIPKCVPDLMRLYEIPDEVINRIFIENPKEFLAY
jgi:predicted metal-dependent phosphotriesterase family hydrolase